MSGGDLPIRAGLVIPEAELDVAFSRSGGPGGQSVNKVETRVTLRWHVAHSRVLDDVLRARLLERLASRLTTDAELVLHASASRSQGQNLATARERLAEIVRAGLTVPRKRRKSRPTRASEVRRREGKQRRSVTKRRRSRPPGED